MRPQYPLPLHHSWPLVDLAHHFNLGWLDGLSDHLFPSLPTGAEPDVEALACHGIGLWQCNLTDNSLTWSPTVYDLFDIPRNAQVSRSEAVALYCEGSRTAMERLRAHAITHRRGFTVDVEIGPMLTRPRWVRLIAAPICEGDEVVGLHGYKCRMPG